MTCILGYISDKPMDKTSMFLATDGRLMWHYPDREIFDYPKIFRFNDFLISFNGEVNLYEVVKEKVRHLGNEIDSIHELQEGINNGFDFEYFRTLPSQSKYSNLIVLDIKHRILAYHYAGDLHAINSFPFRFEVLDKNTLYHFGSVTTRMKEIDIMNDSFVKEPSDYIKDNIEEQIESIKTLLKLSSELYTGIGELYSYYILDKMDNSGKAKIELVGN